MNNSSARIAVLLLVLFVAPVENTFASAITSAAAPGMPQMSVLGTAGASQTDEFGTSRAFANPATGATGVSVQVNAPPTQPYGNSPQGFATSEWSDIWKFHCTSSFSIYNCAALPAGLMLTVSNRVTLSGVVDPVPALDNFTGFTFEEDIQSANFVRLYSFFFSIVPSAVPSAPFQADASFTDYHGLTTGVATGFRIPVTVNGNQVSVDFTIPVNVPVAYATSITAGISANTSIDFYDPIQIGFTSSDPTIQFLSDAGNSTNPAGTAPEPCSMLLAAAGLIGLGLVRARRRPRSM